MTKAESLMVTGILALFSASAFAAPLPLEIYHPAGVHMVKADHQGNGEFEYETELSVRHTSTPTLTERVVAHAHSKDFHVVGSEIKRDDADLEFRRGRQELNVSIESKGHGRIKYEADLDLGR